MDGITGRPASARTREGTAGIGFQHYSSSDQGPSRLGTLDAPGALGPRRESPGTACKPRRTSDTSPSHPGYLVEPADLGHGPSRHGRLVNSTGTQRRSESPGRAGQPLRPMDPGPCPPGQLVEPSGYPTRVRFAWEGWSNLRAVGPESESPGTDGLHRGPLDLGPSHQGQLVDPRGP